jgi:hypothetical protein
MDGFCFYHAVARALRLDMVQVRVLIAESACHMDLSRFRSYAELARMAEKGKEDFGLSVTRAPRTRKELAMWIADGDLDSADELIVAHLFPLAFPHVRLHIHTPTALISVGDTKKCVQTIHIRYDGSGHYDAY